VPDFVTVRKRINYPVGNATSLDITTYIGQFQPGATRIAWGEIIEAPSGETIELNMDGAPLAGEHFFVTTTIQNTNPNTDLTSLQIDLAGGPDELSRPYKKMAEDADQLVIYMVRINLTD